MHPEVPMIHKITWAQELKASLGNIARLSSQRATKPLSIEIKEAKKINPFGKDPKVNEVLIYQNT